MASAKLTDEQWVERYIADDWSGADDKPMRAALKRYGEKAKGHFRLATAGRAAPAHMLHMDIHHIHISDSRRALDEGRVIDLMRSIEKVGLLHPPVVVRRDGIPDDNWVSTPVLVAGRHRMEAWRRLGHLRIEVAVIDADDIEAELIEITENLHRAELTKLQRSEQVARWIELTGTKQEAEVVSRQADAKPGRPEGGVRSAARELGLSEADARRSVKVASLAPEAKAAAIESGLDDNQSALLAAAKETTPERQVEVLRQKVAPKAAEAGADTSSDWTLEQQAASERWSALTPRERDAERAVKFKADFAKIEHLLPEIEEENSLIERLTFAQIAVRYHPVIAFDSDGYSHALKEIKPLVKRLNGAVDVIKLCMFQSLSDTPSVSPADFALAAYDALAADERLAFHEQRPDPTEPFEPPASLRVKIPQQSA